MNDFYMVGFNVFFNLVMMLNSINYIVTSKLYPTVTALCLSKFDIDYISPVKRNCFELIKRKYKYKSSKVYLVHKLSKLLPLIREFNWLSS